MIELISGKPGSGKSYYLTRKVVRMLKRGRLVFSDTPVYVKRGKEILTIKLYSLSLISFLSTMTS